MPATDLLTTAETAALLGCSESMLKHGRAAGREDLPQPVRVGPRQRIFYRRADVLRVADRWERGTVYSPPAKAQA